MCLILQSDKKNDADKPSVFQLLLNKMHEKEKLESQMVNDMDTKKLEAIVARWMKEDWKEFYKDNNNTCQEFAENHELITELEAQ